MQEQLQQLIDLQKADKTLAEIRQRQITCRRELDELEQERTRVQAMVETLEAQLAEREDEARQLHQDLAQERENVVKSEERLPAIKTQKEYVAVLKEIDTAKRLARELEERLETVQQETTALQADRDEKVSALEGLQRQAEEKLEEARAELESLEKELASCEREREKVFKQVPVALQKRYKLLIERRGGVAVVEASQGACLGCNMHLPPQLFNSLYRVKEIQTCPHCNRLLYIAEQP